MHRLTAIPMLAVPRKKSMLVAIKKLLWVAIEVEKRIKPQDDPSLSIRVRVPKSTKNPTWPVAIRGGRIYELPGEWNREPDELFAA